MRSLIDSFRKELMTDICEFVTNDQQVRTKKEVKLSIKKNREAQHLTMLKHMTRLKQEVGQLVENGLVEILAEQEKGRKEIIRSQESH